MSNTFFFFELVPRFISEKVKEKTWQKARYNLGERLCESIHGSNLCGSLNLVIDRLAVSREQVTHLLAMPVTTASEEAFEQLSHDAFAIIADWYHYAILDLSSVKGFRWRSSWIAAKLSISINEVNAALERLERVGLLRKTSAGFDVLSRQNTTIKSQTTSASLREHQQQLLRKAMESLETIPLKYRDNSSVSMAMDSSQIDEAVAQIHKFRRALSARMERSRNKNSVYQLGISERSSELSMGFPTCLGACIGI